MRWSVPRSILPGVAPFVVPPVPGTEWLVCLSLLHFRFMFLETLLPWLSFPFPSTVSLKDLFVVAVTARFHTFLFDLPAFCLTGIVRSFSFGSPVASPRIVPFLYPFLSVPLCVVKKEGLAKSSWNCDCHERRTETKLARLPTIY